MKADIADKVVFTGIYDALSGIAGKYGVEFFNQYYSGGGEKMFKDFERLLSEFCGINFVDPKYTAAQMTEKGFEGCWKIVDQTGALVLTGLQSKEEAERVIRDILGQKE